MRFEEITTAEALNTIVRAAMKRAYDDGKGVTNARAFADAVTRRELENEAAIPGSLRLAYQAAVKQLASEDSVRTNPAAYQPWHEDEREHPVATPTEAGRWMRIITSIQTLKRDHPLRVAVRERCIHIRPWDAENREATPEEEAEYEGRALNDLAHLELVAAENGINLTAITTPPASGVLTLLALDDPGEDDDIPGYGDAA